MSQFRAPPPARPPESAAITGQTAGEMAALLNARTAGIRQLKTNVRVGAAGMPGLRGDLLIERPSRLRLQAGLMGMSETGFDIGSNDEEFWIWQKLSAPGQPETFYHARHLEYQRSQMRQNLQIQPLWLIDALGLVSFQPTDRHEGPFARPDGRVELRTWSGGSSPAIRRLVLDPRTMEIHQQSFYDSRGQLVGWIDSIRHEAVRDHGLSLPRQIVIHVLAPGTEPMKLTVDAGQFEINSIYGDPARLWQMPRPAGVQSVDLAEGQVSMPVTGVAERPAFRTTGQPGYR